MILFLSIMALYAMIERKNNRYSKSSNRERKMKQKTSMKCQENLPGFGGSTYIEQPRRLAWSAVAFS
jgi:hypothetical protein